MQFISDNPAKEIAAIYFIGFTFNFNLNSLLYPKHKNEIQTNSRDLIL
jgi:hypothetical protein